MSRRRQPHRIPPPISHGTEALDSEVILHEFPDELGVWLWKSVRSIRLWGELAPAERAEAFERNAYDRRVERLRAVEDDDLRESLETAAMVLHGEGVQVDALVTACRLVASWAEERGALGTSLEFTQAAALLMPTDAELVHSVAWLARRRGEFPRAESWYRQAIAVSRRTHDWISLAGSYLGLGATFLQRGSHASARLTLLRGMRAAARHSLWEERALLSHEMARLAMRTERPGEVIRSGRAALEAYGPEHPRLAVLALDLGVFWVRSRQYEDGGRVLRVIDAASLEPADRLARAAAMSRAAGALGDASAVEVAWREANGVMNEVSPGRDAALPLLDLARGCAAVGQMERAREAAERASRSAEIRSDVDLRAQAEALLRVAIGEEALPPAPAAKPNRELRRLAGDLTSAFSASAEAA